MRTIGITIVELLPLFETMKSFRLVNKRKNRLVVETGVVIQLIS